MTRRAEELLARLVELRRDLHQHPELGFQEHRTQRVVLEFLRAHGYEPRTCAGTGLIADLPPSRAAAPWIALRADLDALPIDETTALPYRSVHRGAAHKCGHDGHTAILLGVAARLAARRGSLPVGVRLLFQPAEEGAQGGGARRMVAEGALHGVREAYGLHNWPPFPFGEVRVAAGPVMAAVDNLRITVHGVGGHASEPQRCRDPIVAAAAIVTALQTIVSRGVGHRGGVVLTIASLHAGTTHNVIPPLAELVGTLRTFDAGLQQQAHRRIDEVATGVAAAYGVRAVVQIEREYPVLVNDAGCAAAVARAVQRGPRAQVSAEGLPLAAAEDFAYFANAVPSAFFFVGAGRSDSPTPGCHHPDFDFDDRLLAPAIGMFEAIVEDFAARC
jgi:amidohydrolase